MLHRRFILVVLVLLFQTISLRAADPDIRILPSPKASEFLQVAFTPDPNIIVTSDRRYVIALWDAASGKLVREFPTSKMWLQNVSFSPDGKQIVIALWNTVTLYEVATGKTIREFPGHTGGVGAAAFSADGKTILTGSADKTVRLWDAITGKELWKTDVSGAVEAVALSPNNLFAAIACEGSKLKVIRLSDKSDVLDFSGRVGYPTSMRFSADSTELTAHFVTHKVRSWNISTGEPGHNYEDQEKIVAYAVSPDHKFFGVGRLDKILHLHDAETGKPAVELKGHDGNVIAADFSSDGKKVLTGSEDGTARLWDIATGKQLQLFRGTREANVCLTVTPDHKSLAFVNIRGVANFWSFAGNADYRTIPTGYTYGFPIKFSADGKLCLARCKEKLVTLFDVAAGKMLNDFANADANTYINGYCFTADQTGVVLGSINGLMRISERETGNPIADWNSGQKSFQDIACSPDGKFIASDHITSLLIWNAKTRELLGQIDIQKRLVKSIAFSSDSAEFLVAFRDGHVVLYDVSTGKEIRAFIGHKKDVNSARFSPDEKQIVTASNDQTVRVFDRATGKQLAQLTGSAVMDAAIMTSDGKFIFTANRNFDIELWSAAGGLALAQLHIFTDQSWAVIAADGRYDDSHKGDSPHLHGMQGTAAIPLEKLKPMFHTPGLLGKLLESR